MKHVIAVVLGLAFALTGCGNSSNGSQSAINGNWTASLSNSDGTPAFSFTSTMKSTSGSGVTVTNLNFTSQNSCFSNGANATGSFTVSGNTGGMTSGGFQMSVQAMGSNDMLMLSGTMSNNTISGTWTLTGITSGCTGSGKFTMNK